jgi:hypothetical protein
MYVAGANSKNHLFIMDYITQRTLASRLQDRGLAESTGTVPEHRFRAQWLNSATFEAGSHAFSSRTKSLWEPGFAGLRMVSENTLISAVLQRNIQGRAAQHA